MAVGGVAVEDLVAAHGSPLWVVDRAELVGRARAYAAAFAAVDAEVVYAAKALCVVGVVQLVAAEGLRLDVASGGELAVALRAGVEGERLVLHGNAKSEDELAAALDAGVGRIVVDAFSELELLDGMARERGLVAQIWLRVTPGVDAHVHEFVATGQDDVKFGFTLSKGLAHEAVAAAVRAPGLALRGLHCHVGSQVYDLQAFATAADRMVELLADVRAAHDLVLDELNLGGGLGVVELGHEREVAPERWARGLRAAADAACRLHRLPPPRLFVEPGRALVGPAGLTLYRIEVVKDIPDVRRYVAVDGGMSDNIRHALYGAAFAFAPAGRPAHRRERGGAGEVVEATVVGKHCESGDLLGTGIPLPATIARGDLLAVAATGAYTHAMASTYNRVPRPAMVLVGDGEARTLVRRETTEDLLLLDVDL
jgi:diaminopimelate decarboxylase